MLNNLRIEFREIAKEHGLNLNDFPNPDKFKVLIEKFEIAKFPKFKEKWAGGVDHVLNEEIPALMRSLPSNVSSGEGDDQKDSNPFASEMDAEADMDVSAKWAIDGTDKSKYDTKFYALALQAGKASGAQIMNVMMQSGMTKDVLRKIWELSDIDQDGKMDHEEFALCMYLIDMVKGGMKLPPTLPINLIPPAKRKFVEFE
jgi:EH domain-containing protein 3/EH domain-containing protein 1